MIPEPILPSTITDWLRTLPPPPAAPGVVSPRTVAQESVIRFACALWATAPAAPMDPQARAALLARLQEVDPPVPFTADERASLQAPLLAWLRLAHPGIVAIVERQFAQEESSV